MSPITWDRVQAVVRWACTLGVGVLVHRGIIDQDSAGTLALLVAGAVAPLIWSWYEKNGARLKLLTALTMAPGATEADVERHIDVTPKAELPAATTPKDVVPQAATPPVVVLVPPQDKP